MINERDFNKEVTKPNFSGFKILNENLAAVRSVTMHKSETKQAAVYRLFSFRSFKISDVRFSLWLYEIKICS